LIQLPNILITFSIKIEMKKNKKDLKKHGVISVVQSPDEAKSKSGNLTQSNTENKSSNLTQSDVENKSCDSDEHGIISVVQSPDEAQTEKTNK
jgi:hypothetical protein